MKDDYRDIRALTDKEPLWYDENGAPRYAPHSPDLCPDIYANEIVLLKIVCQSCKKIFYVQMSHMELFSKIGPFSRRLEEWRQRKRGVRTMPPIHYGDPPAHGCVGDTMNCIDISVEEFWARRHGIDWKRVKKYEMLAFNL